MIWKCRDNIRDIYNLQTPIYVLVARSFTSGSRIEPGVKGHRRQQDWRRQRDPLDKVRHMWILGGRENAGLRRTISTLLVSTPNFTRV